MSGSPTILQLGHPALRRVAAPVELPAGEDVTAVAAELGQALSTFRRRHGFGRGIAAPQLGHPWRLVGLALDGWPDVIANPEIVWRGDATMTLWDDCMSFPSLLVRLRRARSISVRFHDLDGVRQRRERLDAATSELLQHEIDHLDGVLAVDRALDRESWVMREVFAATPDEFAARVDYTGNLPAELSGRGGPAR